MAGPDDSLQQTGSRPVPDPTELTDKAIAKAVVLLTQYVDGEIGKLETRLDGADRATTLRLATIDDVPHRIDEKVGHLRELHGERFSSIAVQFKERDTRSERESRDNKVAVDAAFAAQKEAAAKQDEGNQKAIDKSEAATAEKIAKLGDLFQSTIDGMNAQIRDVKDRVTRTEASKAGAGEQRAEHTDNRVAVYTTIGLIVSLVLASIAVLGFIVAEAGKAAT